jgi:N6-L-threonylcarbamoyladenine synthase
VHDGELQSLIISTQYFHKYFGGIVPELASRAHIQSIIPIANQALVDARITSDEITHCAVTEGPGLIGSLLVGLNFAKGFALAHAIPLLPINHIEAHIFSTFLEEKHPAFPFICLVASGGHTLLVLVRNLGEYDVLGSTKDDAAGEAFDKVSKMLNLGFPGGPAIEARAKQGKADRILFPRGLQDDDSFDFSFSGLKTSVLYFLRKQIQLHGSAPERLIDDIAASFQNAVIDVLTTKTIRAAKKHGVEDIAVVGGVSANAALKVYLMQKGHEHGMNIYIPEPRFSTDNAAMIANLGYLKLLHGIAPRIRVHAFARSHQFSFS